LTQEISGKNVGFVVECCGLTPLEALNIE